MILAPLGLIFNILIVRLNRRLNLNLKIIHIFYLILITVISFSANYMDSETLVTLGLAGIKGNLFQTVLISSLGLLLFTPSANRDSRFVIGSVLFIVVPNVVLLAIIYLLFKFRDNLESGDSLTMLPREILKVALCLSLVLLNKVLVVGIDLLILITFLGMIVEKSKEKTFGKNVFEAMFLSSLFSFNQMSKISIIIFICLMLVLTLKVARNCFNKGLDKIDLSMSLFVLIALLTSLLGRHEIFYLAITFLTFSKFVREIVSKDRDNLSWHLFSLLFIFSPPFGLGYIVKTQVLESASSLGFFEIGIVGLLFVVVQYVVFFNCISSIIPKWSSIKERSYSFDMVGISMIILSFLLSVLFLPRGWSLVYGDFFFKIIDSSLTKTSDLSLGFYLFWVELLLWTILASVFYKIGVATLERFNFRWSHFSLMRLNFKNSSKGKIEDVRKVELHSLISSGNLKFNSNNQEVLVLITLGILILILLGVQ